MALQVLLAGATMVFGVLLSLRVMMYLDKEHGLVFSAGTICMLCLGSLVAAAIWCVTTVGMKSTERIAWLLVHIFFLTCSVTDHQTCQVYDIFQYMGIGASSYLVLCSPPEIWLGWSLILFAILQYLIFMRLYGKADGMALLVAATAEASLGYDMNAYLLHMIVAYLLLGVIQGIKGNVGRKGKLAKPVAFLPYITVGFWFILLKN